MNPIYLHLRESMQIKSSNQSFLSYKRMAKCLLLTCQMHRNINQMWNGRIVQYRKKS